MLTSYVLVLAAIFLAALISAGMVLFSYFLGRLEAKPKKAKLTPYECGIEPVGNARQRFPVKFYVIAMLFIIFDIEVILIVPWALVYRDLGWSGFYAMLLFLTVLVVGYVYLLRIGAFNWEWWEKRTDSKSQPQEGIEPISLAGGKSQ